VATASHVPVSGIETASGPLFCAVHGPSVALVADPSAMFYLYIHAVPLPAPSMGGRHAAAKTERSKEQKQLPASPNRG